MSTAFSDVSLALEPADDRAFAVMLKRMSEFARAFGLPPMQVETAVPFYRQHLGDLPADVLLKAADKTLAEWTWGNRLPLPGDIRRAASDELGKRAVTKAKIETALRKLRRVGPRPETKAQADARLAARAEQVAKLAARGCRMPPAEREPTESEMRARAEQWTRDLMGDAR